MLRIVFTLIITFSLSIIYGQDDRPKIPENLTSKPEGKYFITAPSGLNLRKKAESGSDKLGKIAFGDQVDLVTPAKGKNLEVDQISGGMARVNFDDVKGYAFEGYLSKIPPPVANTSVESYAEKIRSKDIDVVFEERTKDWGGYIQYEEAIYVEVSDWAEAFLIAQTLFGIPKGFKFPKGTKEGKVIVPNPEKQEYAWTDEMEIIRSEDGSLVEISYNYRGEASGKYVSISIPEDPNDRGLRIGSLQVAD